MSRIEPIRTDDSPREILQVHFKSLGGPLPISGGWGYTKDDACIIDKNDAIVDQSRPFNGVGLEYVFVEKRTYEELIILRPDGHKFAGIQWQLLRQEILHDGPRIFDHLVFNICAFPEAHWNQLKAEFEGPNGFGTPRFNAEDHARKRMEMQWRYERDFWFDITTFYCQTSADGRAP